MESDETLAARAATGERDAFDQLVLRHQARIARLARVLAGGDRYDADDLTQETFIRAYRAMGRFRHDSSFRTWLHRIALNVVWTHLARRHTRAPYAPLEAERGEAGAEAVDDATPSPDDVEAALIRRQAIRRALATLSTDARLVIMLRDMQGLEYHEIATMTGVPIGTVESRLFRARRRLRPLLEPLRTRPRPPS